MGNAARIFAITEAINANDKNVKFTICTWGAGFRFLSEHANHENIKLVELSSYSTACSGVMSKILFLIQLPAVYIKNICTLRRLAKKTKSSLVLLDSDYHFPAFWGLPSRILFLGQAWDVIKREKTKAQRWHSWRDIFWFYLREKFDAYLHTLLSDYVFVPCFDPGIHCETKRVIYIPLIVRPEFTRSEGVKIQSQEKLGLLLSGSGLFSEQFQPILKKLNLKLIDSTPSRAADFLKYKAIVVQGGLSSISECIALGKFIFVIPMPNHPEHILNAQEVVKRRLGARIDLDDLSHLDLDELLRGANCSWPQPCATNGALVMAQKIQKFW